MEDKSQKVEKDSDDQVIRDHYKKIGQKGGLANLEKNSRAHFSMIGKKGAIKRWGKKKPESMYVDD